MPDPTLLVSYCPDLTDPRARSWYVATITVETLVAPDDPVAAQVLAALPEIILSALVDRGFGYSNLTVERGYEPAEDSLDDRDVEP